MSQVPQPFYCMSLMVIVTLLILLLPHRAVASCGLDVCPLDSAQAEGDERQVAEVQLPVLFQLNKFTVGDTEGHYVESLLRAEYRRFEHWVFAASLPIVHLMVDDDNRTGLGNGVILTEWQFPLAASLSASLGAQVELPIGDFDAGIASDHVEALPYGRITMARGRIRAGADLGFRFAVASDEEEAEDSLEYPLIGFLRPHTPADGDGNVLYVNPHEERELLYRAMVGYTFMDDVLAPAAFVHGQRVLSGDSETKTYVNGGFQLRCRLNQQLELMLLGEVPLTSPGRIDWRTGMGVTLHL